MKKDFDVFDEIVYRIDPGGRPRSTIAYPGRDPRFHMTKLNWIQTSLICKDMPKMSAAAVTDYLMTNAIIIRMGKDSIINALEKSWPATSAVEFHGCCIQVRTTTSAAVNRIFIVDIIEPSKGL